MRIVNAMAPFPAQVLPERCVNSGVAWVELPELPTQLSWKETKGTKASTKLKS